MPLPGEQPGAIDIELVPYSAIPPAHVEWLWYPYVPLGRLTTIEGNPGDGKSWFALALATQLSHGFWQMQMAGEESHREPAATVYLSCEDNPHDTIRPRLDILGADLTKILHIRAHAKDGQFVLLSLGDIPSLRSAIRSAQAKLLLIDPVQAYLPKGADMNKAEQMRPILAALNALAEETHCAIVLVRHFGKAVREVTLHKAIGSVDFAAAVRSILVVGVDKRDSPPPGETRHVILQVKNNVSQRGLPLGFTLRHNEFTWSTTTMTEEEFAAPVTQEDKEGSSDRAEAKAFIAMLLAEGPQDAKLVKQRTGEVGLSWRTVNRAKKDMGVLSYQEKGAWKWALS
jgi:archaellum biogenesis ATPase FlaH